MDVPGIRLDVTRAPALFSLLAEVADEMSSTMPNEVWAVADVNLMVTEIGQLFQPPRRILIVGLGILPLLSRRQFRSALAHEYGHLNAGDYKTGVLASAARHVLKGALSTSVGFVIEGALGPAAHKWHAWSREAELRADDAAVRLYGTHLHVETVVRSALGSLLFAQFLEREVTPLVAQQARPTTLIEGFQLFLKNEHEIGFSKDGLVMLQSLKTGALDTHPALSARVQHLMQTPVDGIAQANAHDDASAMSLVSDVARCDVDVTNAWALTLPLQGLDAIPWSDMGARVFAPGILTNFRAAIGAMGALLGDDVVDADALTALTTMAQNDGVDVVATRLAASGVVAPGHVDGIVHLFGLLLTGTALVRGATLVYEPGIPLRVSAGAVTWDPFRLVADAAKGGLAALVDVADGFQMGLDAQCPPLQPRPR